MSGINEVNTQIVVIGGGPGGYSSAFRCADLGFKTVIIENYNKLGGVCLNVGCIPSKSLLHIAKVIEESKILNKNGIFSNTPLINLNQINNWKNKIINKIAYGLLNMAKIRKVQIIHGYGKFINSNSIKVEDKNHVITIVNFDKAIIATGSSSIRPSIIAKCNNDKRIWNSTDALKLENIPNRLMILGGGAIGLEMATVYSSLGTKVDIIEVHEQIMQNADKDLINVFTNSIKDSINIILNTKVIDIVPKKEGLYVKLLDKFNTNIKCYDAILIAVGRSPNVDSLNLDKIGLKINDKGFINVNSQMRTNISNIYAIGDVIGNPLLAHKSTYEGRLVAEIISGKKYFFDAKVIPFIVYTIPEIAWVGLTEKEAKNKAIDFEVAVFPWKSSGKAIASGCSNGMTKLIFDKKTNRIIGGSVVGTNGSEIIGEICLAIEMGCYAEDIALTIHAHPSLHESICLSAEIYEKTITDLINIDKSK
ncbi:MAG: dihydrolipoyl dehydrogenase [Enterobacterales bacterium]